MAKNDIEKPIVDSLQALAFWIGYQDERYRHHDLPEGAIVAELTRLIYGNVENGLSVKCEVLYSDLSNVDGWDAKSLADIAITDDSAGAKTTLALLIRPSEV